MVKIRIMIATFVALTATCGASLAQVPPDIAEGIRKIGPIVDTPNTAKLYAPLFAEQKEPYPNVKGVRDIAYGSDPLNKLDVFTSGAGSGRRRIAPSWPAPPRGSRPEDRPRCAT